MGINQMAIKVNQQVVEKDKEFKSLSEQLEKTDKFCEAIMKL